MKKALSLLSTIVLLTVVGVGLYGLLSLVPDRESAPDIPPAPVQESIPLTRDNLIRLINEERARVGVAPLIVDETLNESAQWKAEDMQSLNYRSHERPGETDNAGLNHARDLLSKVPLDCKNISENLSWNTDSSKLSADQAVNWWKSSQSHYQAMINPLYTHTGFGVGYSIAVQHFCET